MADDELRPFFFSIDEIPAYTIAGMLDQSDVDEAEKQRLYDIFGRDLLTKVDPAVAAAMRVPREREAGREGEAASPRDPPDHLRVARVAALRQPSHIGGHGLLQPGHPLRVDGRRRRSRVDRDPRRPAAGVRRVGTRTRNAPLEP